MLNIRIDENDLKCSICHDIYFEPIATGCGHRFCRPCLDKWLGAGHTHSCPECRHPFPSGLDRAYIASAQPDTLLNHIIKKHFYVRCPLGCKALVHPAKVAEHEAVCPESMVACENSNSGCPCHVKKGNMIDHLKQCPFYACKGRALGCRFCSTLIDLHRHELSCPMRLTLDYVKSEISCAEKRLQRHPRYDNPLFQPTTTNSSGRSRSSTMRPFVPYMSRQTTTESGGQMFTAPQQIDMGPIMTFSDRQRPANSDLSEIVNTDMGTINLSIRHLSNLDSLANTLNSMIAQTATDDREEES